MDANSEMTEGLPPQVLILADVPSPHQNVFFDAIARRAEVDLEVAYCRRTMPGRAWSGEGPRLAKHVFLPPVSFRDTPSNPTLLPYLLGRPARLPFVIGYYLPGLFAAGLALGALRRPWVFWMDALQPLKQSGPWLRRGAARLARRWYLHRATAFLSTGTLGRRALLEAGVAPERAFEIPFVIDQDWIHGAVDAATAQRGARRRALGVEPEDRLVLFVGQMIRRKGVDLLIEATAALPEAQRQRIRVLLVGNGADQAAFEAQVASAQLADRILFHPNIDNSQLPALWAASDVFVLPSRQEAWGVVVDEALAAGLPVLGSDVCGAVIDRVESGVNGWTFPTGDATALRDKLALIATLDDSSLKEFSAAARRSMAAYTPDQMARRFTEVVKAIQGR